MDKINIKIKRRACKRIKKRKQNLEKLIIQTKMKIKEEQIQVQKSRARK